MEYVRESGLEASLTAAVRTAVVEKASDPAARVGSLLLAEKPAAVGDAVAACFDAVRADAPDGAPFVLHAFPWTGENVRMALPTRPPPTLAWWAEKRALGQTEAQRTWKGVPVRAMEMRGRFVRRALKGALAGLATLHQVGLLHQSLSPQAVMLSTEDDRKGDSVSGMLQDLQFCRDARSLAYVNEHLDAAAERHLGVELVRDVTVTHKGGITSAIYRNDGHLSEGRRTDWSSWGIPSQPPKASE